MKSKFCNYEISLKLKELGFDEKCYVVYNPMFLVDGYWDTTNSFIDDINGTASQIVCAAPLWQDAIDFFREKHNLDIIVSSNLLGYGFIIYHRDLIKNTTDNIPFQHYSEAREAAILKAIELCTDIKVV